MIQLTPHMRILMAREPVDFRKGIDGLAGVCRRALRSDPFSGTLFVFLNRRRTAIRCLVYDGQGFWLMHKRLSAGRFRYRPGQLPHAASELMVHELQILLQNGDPGSTRVPAPWRPIRAPG
jgi:hypothetical protein